VPSRSPRTELYRLVWASQAPAYAVDPGRRIVFCNEACAAWTGVSVEDLLGAECQYHSAAASDPVATAARGLCPPPGAEQAFETRSVVWAPRQGSSPVFRRATFFAIQHAPGEFAGHMALVAGEDTPLPDSEQQNAATELSRPEQLHAAVAAFRQRQRARFSLERFIGLSPAIKQARRQMQLAASGATRTVIVGPPGSGREQAARAIHLGPADQTVGPLAPLRCELLDAELLQSTIMAFLRRCRQLETERPAALLLFEADLTPITGPSVATAEAVLARLEGREILSVGDGTVPGAVPSVAPPWPYARAVAALAARRLAEEPAPEPPRPLYLREPEARLPEPR